MGEETWLLGHILSLYVLKSVMHFTFLIHFASRFFLLMTVKLMAY